MAASRPPMASCPHCGAIVLTTPAGLVHPMPDERARVRSTLGPLWFAHVATPFDGRFHQCLGSVRQNVLGARARQRVVRRRLSVAG